MLINICVVTFLKISMHTYCRPIFTCRAWHSFLLKPLPLLLLACASFATPLVAALSPAQSESLFQEMLRGGSNSQKASNLALAALSLPEGKNVATSPRGDGVDLKANLAKLQSKDADERLEALRGLEYSLDPRIPAVMLELLNDVGDSIRRVAAHGIGSRWWQIPKNQVEVYIVRLKQAAARSGELGECSRSIALLQQAIGKRMEPSDAISLSPNGRWLIYDRLGLPCLVDVQSKSEELLGFDSSELEGRFGLFAVPAKDVKWHPTKESVAIPLDTRRGTACVVVWTHDSGTHVINRVKLIELVQKRNFKLKDVTAFISEADLKWRGEKLLISLVFSTEFGESSEHLATAFFDVASGSLVLESVK